MNYLVKNNNKSISDLTARLNNVVSRRQAASTSIKSDTELEAKFAKYREERAAKWEKIGREPTFEEEMKEITQEEHEYYQRLSLLVSPEERYRERKNVWYFHESSWYMRGAERYDGYGCTGEHCIPECRYYAETGRIEDEEIIDMYEKLKEKYSIGT